MELFVSSNFIISAPQRSEHCTPDGGGDVLDISVHQKVRLSDVINTDILDSGHLPIIFSNLDPFRMK
jgi:hypothetical protein